MTADVDTIAWASAAVTVTFRTLMMADAGAVADVFNEGIGPGILCLANAEAGKVLVVDLQQRPQPPVGGGAAGAPPPPVVPPPQLPVGGAGLYVFKHAFLCATDGVAVEPKVRAPAFELTPYQAFPLTPDLIPPTIPPTIPPSPRCSRWSSRR